MFKFFISIFLVLHCIFINADVIETIIQWKRLQFAYESESQRQAEINAKIYDPDIPAPIDVDAFYNQDTGQRLVFVTIPKFVPGVPATFGLVTTNLIDQDPAIQPFPSWDWHRNSKQCKENRLVSVFRVKIDRCGILWILDSGNEGAGVICTPQIVAFDLYQWPRVKTPIFKYTYPQAAYSNDSLFVTPIIESLGRYCRDGAYAYVADTNKRSVVFSNLMNLWSQSFPDFTMRPEDAFSTFNISGDTFFLDDGVLGMDLSPNGNALFYSPLSGSYQSLLYTNGLKYGSLPLNKPPIKTFNTPRKSQSAAMAINQNGIALFGLVSNNTINCWDINSYDYGNNIKTVYKNDVTMQFPSGMKIVKNFYGDEELWVMTGRLQKFMTSGYNFSEVNFRISMGNAYNLVSKCFSNN